MLRSDRWVAILLAATAVLMLVAIILVFGVAPDPVNLQTPVERFSQRIFYFHVPTWWIGFLAFFVAAGTGVLYLITRRESWDVISLSSVEIGIAFTTMGLVTGSIWAKPTWNTWWTWDPRLTTAAIGWLMYIGYLMLRGAIDSPERRARFAAVFAIVAFLSVPINFMAIRWWRTIHPVVIGSGSADAQGNFSLGPTIRLVFFYCLFTFTVLYVALMALRVRTERLARRVEYIKQQVMFR
jgi:heme exporter protein C